MKDWFTPAIGFSWIGAVFLALLFVPNMIFGLNAPPGFAELAARERPALVLLERIGQIAVCFLLLFTRDLRPAPWSPRSWLLVAAAILMAVNTYWWIRYLGGPRTVETFYAPLWGIPTPAAILPVGACILLGLYARNAWLVIGAVVLGVGHIGIHLEHARQFR